MIHYSNIYDLITAEETAYQTLPITVTEGYEWHMYKHINCTVLYKNSVYVTGNSDDKPFKNIIRPILNLQYRAEGFDVKDIELFVNDSKKYFKSFLIKKYHNKWASENEIDTFIDDMVENYVDFGGALIKDIDDVKPEVVPWLRIAFCDQTDVLCGTIAEKHFYSPSELIEMKKKGWENIDQVIDLSENYKENSNRQKKQNQTPGKYVEVYEIHGTFNEAWLEEEGYKKNEAFLPHTFVPQMHICTFYKGKEGNKHGISLYKGREKELPYKLVLRDRVYGRALGFGGAEELFEPQVWANYGVQRMKGMLDQASKVIYQTADDAYANRNKTNNLENGEILVHAEGRPLSQINTFAPNVRLFENSVAEWEAHAQQMGAANDSIMGKSPTAGTPFKLQELVTEESHSLHEYRKGKLATFLQSVYRDWIIPHITREVVKGQEFLAELELDELQYVADSLVTCETNKALKEMILDGKTPSLEEIEAFKMMIREEFKKGGNKKFISILKDEMKGAPIDVNVNIAGKQKNLSEHTDKLVNIFRQIVSAPQILQNPAMAKLFNQILESSGLSPVDFSDFTISEPQPVQPTQPQLQTQMVGAQTPTY